MLDGIESASDAAQSLSALLECHETIMVGKRGPIGKMRER